MSSGIQARVNLRAGGFTLAADLELPGRGVTALFGPSGSGKTTLLRWIAGLAHQGHGRLVVNGECWQDDAQGILRPPHRRALGYVFQHTTLFSHLDVRRNLEFGLARTPLAQRSVAFDQAIELLGIGHLLGRRVHGLSGGELQRIGIARALLTSPRLLLLDEPLAALDLARKQEILPYLERLHDALDIPVLHVSHAPDEVARLADHLVVLEGGRVVAAGEIGSTLARLDLPIRLGDDAGVVLAGTVIERDPRWHLARIATPAGQLWVRDAGLEPGQATRLRILARDVSIALAPQDSSISNSLPARIVAVGDDQHPSQALYQLQVGEARLLARLTRRSAARLELGEGSAVWAQVKAVALL